MDEPKVEEVQSINVSIEAITASYQRQLSELHHQIAVKDALLDQAQRELVQLRGLAEALESQFRPAHNGRTTRPPVKRKK